MSPSCAHEIGHRMGAIRNSRWSDIDTERRIIRWRAEHEKTGYERWTPVTAQALAVLEKAQRRALGSGTHRRSRLPRTRRGVWTTPVCVSGGRKPRRLRGWKPSKGVAGICGGGRSPRIS